VQRDLKLPAEGETAEKFISLVGVACSYWLQKWPKTSFVAVVLLAGELTIKFID